MNNSQNFQGSNRGRHAGSRGANSDRHRSGQRRGGGNGFSRPGPFGFKPKPLSPSAQAVANPFGFASHNAGQLSSRDSSSDIDRSDRGHHSHFNRHDQNRDQRQGQDQRQSRSHDQRRSHRPDQRRYSRGVKDVSGTTPRSLEVPESGKDE